MRSSWLDSGVSSFQQYAQHPVAVVGQALFVQLLEGPEHGLHVLDVECLVVVLEVHPARLTGDVALPLVGVLHHRGAAGVVELVDAHGLDLGLVRHAELLHGFQFGGQAVRVPAEAALDAAAALGLVAAHQVLGIAGQEVAVVRQAVGERRTVVEDELVAAILAGIPLVDARLEGAVLSERTSGCALRSPGTSRKRTRPGYWTQRWRRLTVRLRPWGNGSSRHPGLSW